MAAGILPGAQASGRGRYGTSSGLVGTAVRLLLDVMWQRKGVWPGALCRGHSSLQQNEASPARLNLATPMSPNSYKAAEEKLGRLSPRPAISPVSIHPPASWAQNSCQPLGSADHVPHLEALPQASYSSPRGTSGSMSSLTN